MKLKTLVAIMLLAGASSAYAQEDCNKNSSISHEAVKAGNFKDAYAPCMAVLQECPTLKWYTYTDMQKILEGLLNQIGNKKDAEYQKHFNELMDLFDLRMKHIPDFQARNMKGIPSVADTKGVKAVAYLQYAPEVDNKVAYQLLKESVDEEKSGSNSSVLHFFIETSMKLVKADKGHTSQFFQDYIDATKYTDEAVELEQRPNKKEALQNVRENLTAMFVYSGVADCESLQEIYGPQVEANKADQAFLEKTISILKSMRCKESDVYFKASEYMYAINPTADAAVGVGYMYAKKGEYDTAVKYFDEALAAEKDSYKQAEMAYLTSAVLFTAKRYSAARNYAKKAISIRENYGEAYLLLAQIYGSAPNWSDESALNKCTYFVVLDKLNRAKAVDPKVADRANELIATYRKHCPQAKDLFMLGIKAGDTVQVGGWIGESTVVR